MAEKHVLEARRINELHSLDILDSDPEDEFDELVELAAQICGTPISLISLVDTDRQWFKARVGLKASQTGLQESVCAHAILSDDPLVIPDTTQDDRTSQNPLVHNDVHMRFYAGIPLVSNEQLPIGTLCVLDTVPRILDPQQVKALKVLANQVMARISLRATLKTERQLKQQVQQQHDKLLQMNEQLREADESKDVYLAMLSHELRNPLSALHNGLSVIDADEQFADESDTVQMLKRQCTQLTRLLDDLLDVSRISRGKVSLSMQTITLRPILEHSLATVLADSRNKSQTLTLEPPIDDVHINADTTRLTQMVVNLLSNAIRYTPEGGEIHLSTAVTDNTVSIKVRDTGQGIEAADTNRIFDPFIQVKNVRASGANGLGLGLALVRQLAQLHGGSIQVHSDGIGKGSTFTLNLPTASCASINTGSTDRQAAKTISSALDIVLTDDNLDSIRALARLLERRGHRVRLAETGQQALDAVAQQFPDVLLLDIGLPDISGHEIAGRLRQGYPDKALLLIASTGYGQAQDRLRSTNAGFDHHLVKPMNMDNLYAILQEYAEQQEPD
ncbi:ATP-binding protein [Granulosicoccus antarcticus]|uniref:histidine kinase n=1 Tax=Granulosicoccus antarcticus IMCC3135 TaxID=1192854 RepID=A0A2Z2NT16_9GAMM|nr:ATP-binding protein [Granulosicoccus antarcticus]ASJ70737.1 Aerobic respiration control sensor protein ArcB [Granulosicoccus antarcticus IMCC3135]